MSDNNPVIQENAFQAEPAAPADGAQQAYEAADAEQSIENALDEKREAEQVEASAESAELEAEASAEPEAEKEESDEFSSKFAALSRKEKQIREREEQVNAKLAEIEAKLAALEQPKVEEVQEEPEPEIPLEYRLKKDPLNTLAELGLSYEQLTQLALNNGKLTPEMQMELMKQEIDQKYSKELEELRNELVERDKRQEQQQYEETVQNFKTDLTNFVNDSDKYELIRANDAVDVVFDVIEEHYNETGRILSKEEAADQVETYLEQEVEKLLKLNKLKSKLGVQQEAAQPKEESPKPAQTQKAPTLSNAHSAAASKPSRPLTREQSVAQAASLLKWND